MIDTTIRFNDHNSYKVTSLIMCYPFGVQNMSHITHSFQAYATSMLASATRARTKFLDAAGATISDVSHAFAVTTVFGKVDITVAVPSTAVQAQLVLLQGGTDWWIAEPKSEQGEISTPYNVNYQGQLTYITPNGIYTGMMTASQIVVTGTTASPTEDLEQRLVTINNNAINLTSTVNGVVTKTTLITSGGVYTGEIVATQITSGSISADRIASLSITGDKIAASTITGAKIAAGTITADKINVTNLSAVKIFNTATPTSYGIMGTVSTTINGSAYSASGLAIYNSSTQVAGLSNTGSTLFLTRGSNLVLFSNQYTNTMRFESSGAEVSTSSTSAEISFGYGMNNGIGADSTGPYYVKNGNLTYF